LQPAYFSKTRIAPTPSGYLHRGNALSFLLTSALAQRHGAKILLRIDDMDRERYRPGYLDDIFKTVQFLGIHPDEGPKNGIDFHAGWSQLKRLPLYENALRELASGGHLFACTCSRAAILAAGNGGYPGTCRQKRIPLDTPDAAWRLRTEPGSFVSIYELTTEKTSLPLPLSQQDFVVRKRDGFPAYQLCSVVDDQHFGIDLVVRGADLLDSTLAQLVLAQRLGISGFSNARFVHHPLLLGADGGKLSKSAGADSIDAYRNSGGSLELLKVETNAMWRQMGGPENLF
jgi:glutamyl/glutaminyl-tRNA synthetase